jgi:DNA-binding Lrp family transcriptional regulator
MRPARFAFVASAFLMGQLGIPAPAMAETRAYVLVEVGPDGNVPEVLQKFGNLQNCLGIARSLAPDEIVAAVGCNDLASLNESMSNDVARLKGVARVTILMVRPSR